MAMNDLIEKINALPEGEPLYYPNSGSDSWHDGFKNSGLDTDDLKALAALARDDKAVEDQ